MQLDFGHVLLGLFLSLCSGLGTTAGGLITFLPGAGDGLVIASAHTHTHTFFIQTNTL